MAQLRQLAAQLPSRELRRFRAARALRRLDRVLPGRVRALTGGKLLGAVMPLVEARAGAHVRPVQLFPEHRLRARTRLDVLAHVGSWTGTGTSIEPVDAAGVAAHCLRLDVADEREEQLLHPAFSGVRALEVLYPCPFDIRALADELVAALGR